MPRSPKDTDWQSGSALILKPDHVHALGMISIEMANLEMHFGSLLGALIHVNANIGRLIYLTPKAAIARLDIIVNVLPVCIKPDAPANRQIRDLLSKARKLIGKRHMLIHGAWALSSSAPEADVLIHELPFTPTKPPRQIPLSELEEMIEGIRSLTDGVAAITMSLYRDWPPYTSRPKRRGRPPRGRKSSGRLRPSKHHPKPKGPPPSSRA